MIPNPATRAARRAAARTGHQLPTPMANALAWDAILACSERVAGYPVVRFKGRYYLVDHGNPWPTYRDHCKLLARPGDPFGDLCITSDGIVAKWVDGSARRGYRRPTILGVQEDVQPVVSLPVACPGAVTGPVRDVLPGPEPGHDEQLHGGIRRRAAGLHQSELHSETGG